MRYLKRGWKIRLSDCMAELASHRGAIRGWLCSHGRLVTDQDRLKGDLDELLETDIPRFVELVEEHEITALSA